MSFKVLVGSLAYSFVGSVAVTLQASTAGIDASWVIGTLVTVLIAVLTAMGAMIKIAYDTAKKWDTFLAGGDDSDGFVGRANERHASLQQSQQRTYEQLRIQGQLLSELAYSFADIAEELDKEDEVSIDVNVDRVEDLHDQKRDSHFDGEE